MVFCTCPDSYGLVITQAYVADSWLSQSFQYGRKQLFHRSTSNHIILKEEVGHSIGVFPGESLGIAKLHSKLETHWIQKLQMLAQCPPFEGRGGVEGVEASPEHIAASLHHQLHQGGLLPVIPLRGRGEVPSEGKDTTQHRLSLVHDLRQLWTVLGFLPWLELLGIGLLDVGLEEVEGGHGDKGQVVLVLGGVLLSQHPPGPLQQPQNCIQSILEWENTRGLITHSSNCGLIYDLQLILW